MVLILINYIRFWIRYKFKETTGFDKCQKKKEREKRDCTKS